MTAMSKLTALTAREAARSIADGEITSEQLVAAYLENISARDDEVQAWTWLDSDYALEQARAVDRYQQAGHGTGPMHGVPVGIKDIIDTADMPTGNGTSVHDGRQPSEDAAVVTALRDAGAVIIGKTVTTELALFGPGKTRNPHNPAHTPGGSSSGSAAAVATRMVPVAIGSQTAGSILRPASFCGVYGLKPTFGAVPRSGVLTQSAPLDTVGPLAGCVDDLALVMECIALSDPRDPASYARSVPDYSRIAAGEPASPPRFAFMKTPRWDRVDTAAQKALVEFAGRLGAQCTEVDMPAHFENVWRWQRTLQMGDVAKNFGPLFEGAPEAASPQMQGTIAEGQGYTAVEYATALENQRVIAEQLETAFRHYDCILTPASTGPAPAGLDATGDPVLNLFWTYIGVPCISVPLLQVDGMPVGVQLVGARRDDARLLRTARWLSEWVRAG